MLSSALKIISIRTSEAGVVPCSSVVLCYFCPAFNLSDLEESGITFSVCIQAVTSAVSDSFSAQPTATHFISMLFQAKQHLETRIL